MLCTFLRRVNVIFVCSAAFQDIIANIMGTDGDGPIRVFIHKVSTRLVSLPKHSCSIVCIDVDRCIPGLKFNTLTRKWRRTRTGNFTSTTEASFRIFAVGRSYAQFCKKKPLHQMSICLYQLTFLDMLIRNLTSDVQA